MICSAMSHPSWVCGLKLLSLKNSPIPKYVTPFVGVWIETTGGEPTPPPSGKSHPSWVCGLKLKRHPGTDQNISSHPSWVCGLKLMSIQILDDCLQSHPSWVCGLKLTFHLCDELAARHTLRGCVDWNSTDENLEGINTVTPFVGVWIETPDYLGWDLSLRSHPSWVCGLKLQKRYDALWIYRCHTLRGCVDWNNLLYNFREKLYVTPFVGVWIETFNKTTNASTHKSHPSWVCGLKRYSSKRIQRNGMSHPSWVCGLKRVKICQMICSVMSHPSWVCGLKLTSFRSFEPSKMSHPSWVCGLKHHRA